MPKVKISDFSTTAGNNTDINSINIAEGCAPSGINDAIRTLMAYLKDWQSGAVAQDNSFNGAVTVSGAAVMSSTLAVTGAQTNSSNLTINGQNSLRLADSDSSNYVALQSPAAVSANATLTVPSYQTSASIGYLNVPRSGSAKTTSYQLAVTDVGQLIEIGSGGSVTIPDATFAAGDVLSIFNNNSTDITITCSITTAYISGTDEDKATVTLSTRGVATVLFISSTVCVITGNVS